MKDSGIEWIGEIPEHWKIAKIKFACEINPPKNEVSNLPKDLEVSFLPMEKIGEDGKLKLEEKRKLNEVVNGFTYFRNGDVIVAKITPCFENGKGSLCEGLENGIGFGTTELHVLRSKKEFEPIFTYWWIRSNQFLQNGEASMYGAAGQKRISIEFIKNFEISYPESILEQTEIGIFLKKHIEKTDEEIRKNKKTMYLLKEKRQSLINLTVTKGLDSSVPIKDSGVRWIGEIPEHWKIFQIGKTSKIIDTPHYTSEKHDGLYPIITTRSCKIDGRIDYSKAKNTSEKEYEKRRRYIDPDIGDLLYTREAPLGIAVIVDKKEILIGQRIILIKLNKKIITAEFLSYFLNSFSGFNQASSQGIGTTVGRVNIDDIKKFYFPVPNIEEQNQISKFLKNETLKINSLISKTKLQIKKLKELHQTIISQVVTGKVDVTSLA